MTQSTPSLTTRTAKAAQWRLGGSVVGAISQFGIGVLLARLLPPSDFGLIALAFVVVGLVRPVGDAGIANAIVQRKELTDRHIRTGFTVALLTGIFVTLALSLLAPFTAVFLGDPRVTRIIRFLAFSFCFQGIGVVAGALLRRRLDFRRVSVIDSISYVFGYGLVAVSLALRQYGVWSLVFGGLAQSLLGSAMYLLSARHSVRPLLRGRELKELMHFGVGASLNSLINYLALNADNFVVGRWMGAVSLGLYSRAYSLMSLPYTYGANAMSGVLFPAFSEVQGEVERLRRAYLLATRFTAVLAGCAMATLCVAAPDLIVGLYGPKWIGVVIPLQILCFAGYFRALYHLGGVVVQSVGLVYSEARRQALYAALVVAGALAGTSYGLRGVAVGVTGAILYMFVATAQLALGATATTWPTYLRAQGGAVASSLLTGVVAFAAHLAFQPMHSRPLVKALLILAAAAVPSVLSLGWLLGEQQFDSMRNGLPATMQRLVAIIRGVGNSAFAR